MASNWQICAEKIRQILPDFDEERTCKSDRDLCVLLQDGEVLCEWLMGVLDNHTGIYCVVSTTLMAEANVKTFLSCLTDKFQFTKSELFKPNDLVDLSNVEAVMETLLLLFQRHEKQNSEPRSQYNSNGNSDASNEDGLLPKMIEEWLQRERSQLNHLRLLANMRNHLMESIISLWTPELCDKVFKYVNKLLKMHKNHLPGLESLESKSTAEFCSDIGQFMKSSSAKFKVYSLVMKDFQEANTSIKEHFEKVNGASVQAQKLLEHLSEKEVKSLESLLGSLKDYVFHIRNILERMVKTVDKEQPDAKSSVEQAFDSVSAVMTEINEYMEFQHERGVMNQFRSKIANLSTEEHSEDKTGLHVADGNFKVKIIGDNRKTFSGKCLTLVTQKMLIFASEIEADKFEYQFSFEVCDQLKVHLDSMTLTLTLPGHTIKLSEIKSKARNTISIANLKLKLDELYNQNFPVGCHKRPHSFKRTTLPKGVTCSFCSEIINGYINQGFMCACCDQNLHWKCVMDRYSRSSFPPSEPEQPEQPEQPPKPQKPAQHTLFHPNASRDSAESLLKNKKPGSFLFRPKTDNPSQMVLTMRTLKSGVYQHIIVNKKQNEDGTESFELNGTDLWCSSVDELIQHFRTHQIFRYFRRSELKTCLSDGIPFTPN